MLRLLWVENQTRQGLAGGDIVDYSFGLLDLDVVESDNYEASSTLTTHTVEEGIPVTDNRSLHADRYSVMVYVSERPASITLVDGATMTPVELTNGQSVPVVTPPEGTTRKADAFDALLGLVHNANLVSVEGSTVDLEDWVLEHASFPRTVDDSGLLVSELSFVEYRTVTFEEVDVPAPRVERGRRRSSRGNQQNRTDGDANARASTNPADREEATGQLVSTLARVLGGGS